MSVLPEGSGVHGLRMAAIDPKQTLEEKGTRWRDAHFVGAGLPAKQAPRWMAPAVPVSAGRPAPTKIAFGAVYPIGPVRASTFRSDSTVFSSRSCIDKQGDESHQRCEQY